MADDPRQGLLPAYLVVGKDVLKREKVIERLESHLDPSLLDFNLERIEASSEVEPVDFVASFRMPSSTTWMTQTPHASCFLLATLRPRTRVCIRW